MKAIKSLSMLSWLLLFPFIAHAGDVPGTYENYQWDPGVTGLTSVDYIINVQADPGYRANVLWSTRFNFVGTSNGGYAGMEDNANLGPNFVFSVRGATQYMPGSAGSYCAVNDRGVTCRLPNNGWQSTDQYQFHVAYEGGRWLGVTVTLLYSNPLKTFNLGSILTDATSILPQGIVSRTNYLEAISPTANCYNQPYSDAVLGVISGNNGQYTPTGSSTGTNTTCASFSSVLNNEQVNGAGNLLRGEAVGGDGLCIDAGDGKTNDVAATTQACNKKAEGQAWVYAKDGTMRLQSNLCLDIANADPSAGAVVIADQCNGSTSQQWSLYGDDNMLQSNLSGYCVTEGSAGAQLTLQECSGNSQIWTLPLLPVLP